MWAKIFFSILFVAFLAGGLFSGYLFYATVKEVVAYVQIPSLPHLPGPAPRPTATVTMRLKRTSRF